MDPLPTRPQPDNGRIVRSWVWAWAPVWTLGIGTAPPMIWAAVHKRSWLQGLFASLYVVATVIGFIATPSGPAPNVGLFTAAIAGVNFFVGFFHAQGIRRWAFDLPKEPPEYPEPPAADLIAQQKVALAESRAAASAREEARKLATDEPLQALRLQVGRIDIPDRAYPDGGLIDVNNVPTEFLAAALGIPEDLAGRIAEAREAADGFESADEMAVLADLPPRTVETTLDLLVFLPRR